MRPSRNALSACSRAPCPRSPWTAPTAKPRSASSSDDLARGALGAREHHRRAAVLRLQGAGEHLDLVHRVGAVDELRGLLADGRGVDLLGADVRRLRQERARQRDDRPRHGGREQHRLALVGKHAEDALDVGQEAQVEHLVGLVEHQPADLRQHQVSLLGEVEQTARGADHQVDAALQRRDLALVGAPAVDREDARAEVGARGLDVLGDLDAQLAGGDDHQDARRAVLGGAAEALQQRDAEAEGLAGAGARLADEVVAGERQRQRQLLDGERAHDPGAAEGRDDRGVDAELGESGGVLGDGGVGLERLDGRLLVGVVAFGLGSGIGRGGGQGSAFLAARAHEAGRLARPRRGGDGARGGARARSIVGARPHVTGRGRAG